MLATFVSVPVRSKMLYKMSDLKKYLTSRQDLDGKVRVLDSDSVGFFANVGALSKERFDFPFNGEAFYEILESQK